MRSLLRYYGFRRIAAQLAGLLLGGVASRFFRGWEWSTRYWSREELAIVYAGDAALTTFIFIAWLYVFLRPWIGRRSFFGWTSKAIFLVACICGVWRIIECSLGLFPIRGPNSGQWVAIGKEILFRDGLLVLIVFLPLGLLEVYEVIHVTPFLRRWFVSHRGHVATWIRAAELRRFIKPLQRHTPSGCGYTGNGIFLGRTLFEDDGRGGTRGLG